MQKKRIAVVNPLIYLFHLKPQNRFFNCDRTLSNYNFNISQLFVKSLNTLPLLFFFLYYLVTPNQN